MLWYIAEHNIYEILGTKVMDRIMQDYWRSNIDVTGTLLEASTAYRVLSKSSLKFTRDEEKENRFYLKKDLSTFKSHQFQFHVWMKSMQVRYAIESISFITLAFIFQYFITLFNKDVHILREDREKLA